MADDRPSSSRRFGRRRRGDRSTGSRPVAAVVPAGLETLRIQPSAECLYCRKPILDLASAIADRDSGEPVHFDCALQRVTDREALQSGERLVYIGSGSFAVVEFRGGAETAFTVKRRVPFEEEGKKRDWRKALSARAGDP
ncbi:MAG TPA: hypothetical protein VLH39_06980 [Magnetospirillaceae bacterium]|nr:hypothetical protein [Magnetospirillaceae bacterium]